MVQFLHVRFFNSLSGRTSPHVEFCRDHPLRLAQLLLACIYGVLIGYSALHKGWWMDISLPVTLGCRSYNWSPVAPVNLPCWANGLSTDLSVGFTICPFILSYDNFRHGPGVGFRATLAWFSRFSFDLALFVLWTVTGYIMCFFDKGKDYRNLFKQPPYKTWSAASFITGFESVYFAWTGILILKKAKDRRDARSRGHQSFP